jgi:hypothetical protein
MTGNPAFPSSAPALAAIMAAVDDLRIAVARRPGYRTAPLPASHAAHRPAVGFPAELYLPRHSCRGRLTAAP